MSTIRLVLLGQAIVVVGVVLLLGLAPHPFQTSLLRWDAEWYASIRAHGYFFSPMNKSSVAFFPFFPMVWRLTHLGAIGISLFNMALAAASIYLLYKGLQLRPIVVALFAAFPSSMFLYLPYTEACFFFFSSLVVLFVARPPQRGWVLPLTLFGGALTRVTAFFYVPALAVVEGMAWLENPSTWPERLRRLVGYGLATGAGLVAVMTYQWSRTGVWFAFNKAQAQWDHHFRVPQPPFISTSDSDGAVWIDGLAILAGVVALGWLLHTAWRVARHRQPAPDRLLLLSATYITAATFQTVLNAPIEHGSSSLLSLHRYVFCSPFFLVVLERLLPRRALGLRAMAPWLVGVLTIIYLLGMFSSKHFRIEWPTSHIPGLFGPVAGLAYGAFVLVYALLWLESGTRWGRALVYVSSFGLQLLFAYTYSVGHWIG